MSLGEWSEAQHRLLEEELAEEVRQAGKEAERFGTLKDGPRLPAATMFEDVFKHMPQHLALQLKQSGL